MTEKEISELSVLLGKFLNWNTDDHSFYGRKMDRALARDLHSALIAYSLPYIEYQGQKYVATVTE